ncbi:MAG TPA: FHA domain-containing protein [Anaerolineales bacterium]|nr:FHA domain-containing protein [Anaerolineales bacterium]
MDGHYLLIDSTGNATEVDGELMIGRGKEAGLILKDKLVSRHHATVYMEGEVLMVRDEDSVNGSFVNGKQIYEPTALNDQDKVQFGDEVLIVRAPLGEQATVRDVRATVEEVINKTEKEPELAEKPEIVESMPVDVSEAEMVDGEDGGGKDNKKLFLIIAIVLVVLCCCVILGVAGWFVVTNSSSSSFIESGQLLVRLL